MGNCETCRCIGILLPCSKIKPFFDPQNYFVLYVINFICNKQSELWTEVSIIDDSNGMVYLCMFSLQTTDGDGRDLRNEPGEGRPVLCIHKLPKGHGYCTV